MKHLYKIVQGNHTCVAPMSDEHETELRSKGYMLAEELWPDPNAVVEEKPKRKVNGRNSA